MNERGNWIYGWVNLVFWWEILAFTSAQLFGRYICSGVSERVSVSFGGNLFRVRWYTLLDVVFHSLDCSIALQPMLYPLVKYCPFQLFKSDL